MRRSMASQTERYQVIESAFAAACVNRNDVMAGPITQTLPGIKVILPAELVKNSVRPEPAPHFSQRFLKSLRVDPAIGANTMIAPFE